MNWYDGNRVDVVRVCDTDAFVVDYDKRRGMYRVSLFEDGHYVDEVVFEEYRETDVEDELKMIGGKFEGTAQQGVGKLVDGVRENVGAARKRVTVYTDGACLENPGPGGWAAIVEVDGVATELSGGEAQTTNNRMELLAVISALEYLKEPAEVIVYADSQYVINGIEKGWAKNWRRNCWMKSNKQPALNPDLWDRLLGLCDKHKVRFHWVRGHAGNPKNERCDKLARGEAARFVGHK